jgi:Ni,Fe-hydrogenase maturation factor
MKRVDEWIRLHPGQSVEVVEDFQFQVEHTLDLQGRDLALFVDAAAHGPGSVALSRITPAGDSSFSTHALSPPSLLHAFLTLDCGPPPPAFALSVRGETFGLGQDLSPQARENLELGWTLLKQLLENPSPDSWDGLCAAP